MAILFKAFDADNHYYEPTDAFTRHLDRAVAKRAVQWAEIEGKQRLIVAGRINRYIPNPTFDPVSRPGALADFYRAKGSVTNMRDAFGKLEPMSERPEYRNRDARLARMDEQNLEACFMLPTLAVGMEAALEGDPEALVAAFTAFNRWLEEDWGFAYQERIFATPYLTLADPDWAVDELEYVIGRGARVVLIRPGPPAPQGDYRSLGDPRNDRFWERLDSSGLTLVLHGGESSYNPYEEMWGLRGDSEAFRIPPLKRLLSASPIRDSIASLLAEGVLERFPNIRVATIETGSGWVAPLLKKLETVYVQSPDAFGTDPVELFKERVWVSPFFEDDVTSLVKLVGADRVLFGSDFPHAEGLAEPTDFVDECIGLTDDEIRKIMRDNAWAIATPRPR
jgi:predicted TIM-barrel fold metal-dependent hydrolase